MAKAWMRQAISLAMERELAADPDVIVMGEDIAAAGGVFKATAGLLEKFGPERVRDTPISETGFLGAAVGAAMCGLRPVVEIMFMDFLGVAFDQLVTQAAKVRFLSAGQYTCPLVVRGSAGHGLGFGAQHSQHIESWALSTSGLKIVMPSGVESAYGLLRAAIRDPDPVLFLEPRSLYQTREEFDEEAAATLELGHAKIVHPGQDVTVLALGAAVGIARQAAELSTYSVEVIDLMTPNPLDTETVLASVRRTGHLATVESGPLTGGWGATVASRVCAEAFDDLRAPVLRLTAPDVPIPYAESLELAMSPTPDVVAAQLHSLIEFRRTPNHWWAS
jgi:acetoin:2,6-dichlorophenolindophenol oxidoreductase subunit beta